MSDAIVSNSVGSSRQDDSLECEDLYLACVRTGSPSGKFVLPSVDGAGVAAEYITTGE